MQELNNVDPRIQGAVLMIQQATRNKVARDLEVLLKPLVSKHTHMSQKILDAILEVARGNVV
jgi:hypothetical protein